MAMNHQNRYGETSLIIAVKKFDVAKTKRLLEKGADPDIRDNYEFSPLLTTNDNEIMEALLEHGANPDQKDICGNTPLSWSVVEGRLDNFASLLKYDADQMIGNNYGQTIFTLENW